jgi:hypothetical protein
MISTPTSRVSLDHQIFSSLAESQVVRNQQQFSRLLGRSPSYFSAMQSKQMPISVSSLVKLALELRKRAAYDSNTQRSALLNSLCDTIYSEICDRSL